MSTASTFSGLGNCSFLPSESVRKMFRCVDHILRRTPAWYRTPLAQSIALGIVFFFVFASYTTIQFYARTTYGENLAADSVSAIYASFTVACLFAPSVTNKLGCRKTMFLGVLGYVALVAASLVYFLCGDRTGNIVVAGGIVLGCGAALLWTAQGRLILQYAAEAERLGEGNDQSGTLMGAFWAVFQCSSLVGGAISFAYYTSKPTGSARLYVMFLVFILLGAVSTQLLLPPSMLQAHSLHRNNAMDEMHTEEGSKEHKVHVQSYSEETKLIGSAKASHPMQIDAQEPWDENDCTHEVVSKESWSLQAAQTLRMFFTRPMLALFVLFFYTGFNQPYQQATFGNRFFTRRTIGIELIVFHVMEIVGAIYCGRILDGNSINENRLREIDGRARNRRRLAVSCLVVFVAVNMIGNILALIQEYENMGAVEALDVSDVRSLRPSMAFACWGFADSQIQVYCYWLLGALFSSGDDHARAVGFYKCVQSLGVSVGFYLTPLSRLGAISQLLLSFCVFIVGSGLSLLQLPK